MDSIILFLTKLLDFIKCIFEKKTEREDEQVNKFNKLCDDLRLALSEGRTQDAWFINKKIHSLRDNMNKNAKKRIFIFLLAPFLILAGCKTANRSDPVVLGDRVHICKPGESITVPLLIYPARSWYLVDDVGLIQWLGIDVLSGGSE